VEREAATTCEKKKEKKIFSVGQRSTFQRCRTQNSVPRKPAKEQLAKLNCPRRFSHDSAMALAPININIPSERFIEYTKPNGEEGASKYKLSSPLPKGYSPVGCVRRPRLLIKPAPKLLTTEVIKMLQKEHELKKEPVQLPMVALIWAAHAPMEEIEDFERPRKPEKSNRSKTGFVGVGKTKCDTFYAQRHSLTRGSRSLDGYLGTYDTAEARMTPLVAARVHPHVCAGRGPALSCRVC